jgi:hypothetical protein
MYIYTHTHTERERERERERETHSHTHTTYTYIYMCAYTAPACMHTAFAEHNKPQRTRVLQKTDRQTRGQAQRQTDTQTDR